MSAYALNAGSRNHPGLAFGLALMLHTLAAALLFWSFQWEIPQPKPMQLEIWSAAAAKPTPVPPAPVVEEPKPVVEDIPPAEINRKKPLETPIIKPKPVTPPEKPSPKVIEAKAKPVSKAAPAEDMDDLLAALDKKAAAGPKGPDTGQLLSDYQKSLSQLILPRVIYSGDTGNNPTAEFRITVLSTMSISDVELLKSSGNPQWDNAAEKAILMNKKLPSLPQGLSYSPELRTMRIKLCPKSCH